jgi:CRP/FNR family transcriptional regulator, cyclic AMP receptor protein
MVVANALDAQLANDISLLAPVPIFRHLSPDELTHLARASRRVVFQPGDALVRKGEEGDCVYVILEGRVEALANEAVVSWLAAGDTVGDMSLFDGRPRSATCVALTPTTCLRLDREAFLNAARRNWSMTVGLFSVLADRIRQADELLAEHARDPLTGVNNRRALLDLYDREAQRTKRAARQASDHALSPPPFDQVMASAGAEMYRDKARSR